MPTADLQPIDLSTVKVVGPAPAAPPSSSNNLTPIDLSTVKVIGGTGSTTKLAPSQQPNATAEPPSIKPAFMDLVHGAAPPQIQTEEVTGTPQQAAPKTQFPISLSRSHIINRSSVPTIGPNNGITMLPDPVAAKRAAWAKVPNPANDPQGFMAALETVAKTKVSQEGAQLENAREAVGEIASTNMVEEITGKTLTEHYQDIVKYVPIVIPTAGGTTAIMPGSPAHQFIVRLSSAVPGIIDFAATPGGAATLALTAGAGGNEAVQRGVSAAFASDLDPEAVEKISSAIQSPTAENTADAIATAVMAYGVSRHTVEPFKALTTRGDKASEEASSKQNLPASSVEERPDLSVTAEPPAPAALGVATPVKKLSRTEVAARREKEATARAQRLARKEELQATAKPPETAQAPVASLPQSY